MTESAEFQTSKDTPEQRVIKCVRASLNETTLIGIRSFIQEVLRLYDLESVGLEKGYD